jgi:dipeptidase E
MKFILHSDQSLQLTAELDRELIRSLTGKRRPSIGYITSYPDPRRRHFQDKAAYYEKLGYNDISFIDPLEPFEPKEVTHFFSSDVIHLPGGEVGYFLTSLKTSGFDELLRKFLATGGLIIGVSAGAMLLCNTIEIAQLYGEKKKLLGLGFFDFEICPHAKEYFPNIAVVESFAKKIRKDIYILNDGDVLKIINNKIKTYGDARKIGF